MPDEDEAMVKILIVDDRPDNRRLLAHLARDQGYETAMASNGRQALKIALVERPDVLLLDIMMPGMDGIEVCRRWKADEALRKIPVILVTAKDLDEDMVRGLDAGADDYVTMPFNRDVLAARLRSAIRLKQSYDAVMHTNEELQREVQRRIQSESDLRASEQRYRELLGAVTTYTYSVEIDAGVPYSTQHSLGCQAATGYAPQEYASNRYLWMAMVHPDDREMVEGQIAGVLRGENVPPLVHRIYHKDGGVRWLRDTIVPHYNSAGQLVRYDGLVEDITEGKLAEESVRKKDEQLGEAQKLNAVGLLAGGIAHEFNNLLQVIGGYTTCAMEDLSPREQRYEDLQRVRTATDRAAALTRQLLGFSRRRILQPDNVDPNQLVGDLAQMLQSLVGDRISVEVVLRENIGTVYADPGELQQALLNLCLNARDAMPSGGTLLLNTDTVILAEPVWESGFQIEPGRYVVFGITDTGQGISAEVQQHIFEPFFTTKGVGKGTGLGLAMVYGMVQQHRGAIHVDSEPGKGTTFKVYLPEGGKDREEKGTEEPVPVPRGRETILVAEDEPMVRSLAVRILERGGYRVLAASDGEEALRVFKENSRDISLTLLDAIMPTLTGHEVYRHIKAEYPGARVLFASGYDSETARSGFIFQERLRLIEKPFDADTLLRAVREALDEDTSRVLAAEMTA
jgi:PAS domain S-box-containing protein